jgi:hypothetical protein
MLTLKGLVIPEKSLFPAKQESVILSGIPFGFYSNKTNGIPHKFSFAARRENFAE